MTDEDVVAIPFSDYPEPAVAYAVGVDEPRITATNEAFETRFSALSTGTPVTALFEVFNTVESRGEEDPLSCLSRGDGVSMYVDDTGELGPFHVRVLPAGDDTGYIVFSDVSGYPDIIDTPAVSWASSVISHDLRNSLDVANAHLQAAEETGDPEHFEAIATAHDRMERIIRDVLAMTRGETAVTPSEQVTLGNTAKAAWQAVDTGATTVDIESELPTVSADADRVRRVFENLFRNAVEHGSTSPDSQARQDSVEHGSTSNRTQSDDAVEHGSTAGRSETDDRAEQGVNSHSQSDAGRAGATDDAQVTVTVGSLENGFYVADNGVGIPSDKRENVTEPGYSTRTNGTGLGLAIVEQIVAAHGWELTVTSATNGGSRFEIRF